MGRVAALKMFGVGWRHWQLPHQPWVSSGAWYPSLVGRVSLNNRHWLGKPKVLAFAFSSCGRVRSALGALQNQTGNVRVSGPHWPWSGVAGDGDLPKTQRNGDMVGGVWDLRSAATSGAGGGCCSLGSKPLALSRIACRAVSGQSLGAMQG